MKKILLLTAVALCLVSCNDVYRYTDKTFYAMSTVVNVIRNEKIQQDDSEDIISGIERKMSRTNSESEIYSVNEDGDGTLSDDTLFVLEKSLEIAENTGYAFNPCMGTLSDVWDITSGKNYVPTRQEIEKALSQCQAKNTKVKDGKVIKTAGQKIDLGGVAKGYALEKAANSLKESAQKSGVDADFCINLGGNVAAFGTSESRKNKGEHGWNVGITNPFDKNTVAGRLVLCDKFISISGTYERFFEKDGKIYHHIFDPKTGYPADSGLLSCAVVNNNGLEGDALSTALLVMGKDKAIEFYREKIYDFEMILVTDSGEVYVSDGIFSDFTLDAQALDGGNNKLKLIKIQA